MGKPLTNDPCPRCMGLMEQGHIQEEWVQRLPKGAFAPLATDGSGPCCTLCGLSDTMCRFTVGIDFDHARIAIGQDWAEGLRLPGVKIGVTGWVPAAGPGDLEDHHAWLTKAGLLSDEAWMEGIRGSV